MRAVDVEKSDGVWSGEGASQSEVQIGPPMRKGCGKEGPCFDIDGQAIDTRPRLPIPVNNLSIMPDIMDI